MDIGQKIKQNRQQLGLTQEELAERSGLTKGFISQLERDLTSPSVDSLADILEALGTSFSAFFSEERNDKIIFREDDFFETKDDEKGYKMTWLVPNAQKNDMEPIIMTLRQMGETKVYTPFEGEEFGYVLKGTIELIYDDKKFKLKKGESFYLRANAERQIINKSKGTSEIMWISSPPGF